MAESILYFVAFYIAFQHLLAPLIVWRINRSPCSYSFPPIGWQEALEKDIPELRAAHSGLESCGFHPVAASGFGTSHASMLFFVYRHPTDLAFVTLMRGKNWLGAQATVVFTQAYSDGSQLYFSNSAIPGVFPPWERLRGCRLPGLTDIQQLYTRFGTLRDRSPDTGTVTPPEGSELQFLEDFNNAQTQYLCDIGYMHRECGSGGRRFTIAGAYRSSWKLLQPWQWLRSRLDRADALRKTAT